MNDKRPLNREKIAQYAAAMQEGDWQEGPSEPITVGTADAEREAAPWAGERELLEEATARVAPWTLVVTFTAGAHYDEAERLTGELLFPPDRWELRPVVQYKPVHRRIRIGGQRQDLVGPLAFYLGGWDSAQIELRPTALEG